jgi:hypothetical protein
MNAQLEQRAERLGDLLTEEARAPSADARARFLAAASAAPAPLAKSRRGGVFVAAGALALAAALVLWLAASRGPQPISYQVVTPAAGEPGRLVAGSEALGVRFSDGSRAELEPRAEARVAETHENGATLRLMRGKISANVVHTGSARWAVQAGPYTVRVVGTRFTTAWNPQTERLEVRVTEGAVRVESTQSGSVLVSAGQRLDADAKENTHAVSSAVASALPPPEVASAVPSAVSPPVPVRPSVSVSPFAALSKARKAGDFEAVIAAANAAGVERCLASCNDGELLALADAARYTSRAPLAERALLALRARGGASATLSAFLLARQYDAAGSAAALTWYDRYLAEASSGSYAAEALAGKMNVLSRSGQAAAASRVARQYLERYPQGTHATASRRLALASTSP